MKKSAILAFTWTTYWIILPVTLIASVIFRYNLLSCIYLIFVLALPFSPRLSPDKISTWAAFSLALTIMSGLFLLSCAIFQIALLAHSPYGSLVGKGCSHAERIARYVGFERFDHADVGNIFRLLLPDIAVFLVALLSYVLIRKATHTMSTLISNGDNRFRVPPKLSSVRLKNGLILTLNVLFMALAGIAFPNVLSFVYFFVFIVLAMVWAFHYPLLVPVVAGLRAALSVLAVIQLLLLYVYQMEFMQTWLPADALSSRLLGFTAIILTDCDATYKILLQPNLKWTKVASPFCVFLLHWTLAVGVRMFYQDLQILNRPRSRSTSTARTLSRRIRNTEKKPLVREEELPENYESITRSPQSAQGNSTEPDEVQIQLEEVKTKDGVLLKISLWFDGVKKYSFYVVALIVMMLWSVTYHSWLTFVLLLWSCVLWMTKDRAKYTLNSSPAFVFYGIGLVLLQYVYALDLNETELPTTIVQSSGNVLYLSEFGLHRFTYPCLHLGAQILYLCGFWLVLHQFNYRSLDAIENRGNQSTISEPSFTEQAAAFVYEILCKYWIFLVIGFHLAVASEGYPTGIKIIYMVFLLLNIVTYSIIWSFWRRCLTIYWTVLVAYTMIVLILIYTYQFKSFPMYWKSFTNFSDEQLADLGLTQSPNTGQLLLHILIPALFLLAIILQLQYFNKRFLQLTEAPVQVPSDNVEVNGHTTEPKTITNDEVSDAAVHEENKKKAWFFRQLDRWLPTVIAAGKEITSFVSRMLEFHLWRLIFVTVFAAAVSQISALYAAFVLVWVLLLPFRKLHLPLFLVSTGAASIILVLIMFYQLQFIAPDVNLSYNCTIPFYGKNVSKLYHLTDWIGVGKMEASDIFFFHVQGYIAIILMIAFERTVMRRQAWRRLWHNEPVPPVTALYPSVTYKEVDDGLLNCAKFFVNYFFFKFGVQACFVMTVITAWVHTDIFSIFYCILLIIALTLKTRASLYRFWRFYIGILVMLILWQYLSTLGLPPVWCQSHQYAWTTIGSNETIRNRLVLWLHLPDYIVTINSMPSIADFFQLIFVVSQLFVFESESSLTRFIGDNRYLTGMELDEVTVRTNPKKNFMLKESRTLLDLAKHFVFKYTIWITMTIIFFAGTSRISVFTLGYLICFFYMLSKQQQLLMGKPSHLLKVFTGFLGYTVAVITMKAGLQIASCVYIDILASKACVFVQFMSLVCSKPVEYKVVEQSTDSCEVSYDSPGLHWDFVCFLFLLIQLRIFASHYFLHVAEDLRTSMQLAARGAELSNDKLIEEVKEREKIQEENINAIKKSMAVIKEAYQTLRRSLALQKTHTDAIRSGDYYMFDDNATRKDLSASTEEDKIMDPIDMLHVADTVGINEALSEREEDKRKLETDDRGVLNEKHDDEEKGTEQEEEEETPKEDVDVDDDVDVGGNVYIRLRKKYPVPDNQGEFTPHQSDTKVEVKSSDSHHEDEDTDEDSEDDEDDKMSFYDKVKQGVAFIWEFFMVCVDSIILFLNQQNKDYRNVYLQLSSEKAQLSEPNFKQEVVSPRSTSSDVSIDIDDGDAARASTTRKSWTPEEYVELRAIDFDKDLNRALKLVYAFWYTVVSRTDMVCYFLIILNLMLKASILALVLPLAVLLWATLSIPRPSKFFWMFTIVYLEVVVVVKFIFQFEFFPWNSQASTNQHSIDPFWWPRFLGIEQTPSWSVMDLLQLLAVFFHVSVLKVHGLWDTAEVANCGDTQDEDLPTEERPSTSQHALAQEEENQTPQENNKQLLAKLKDVCHQPYIHYHSILNQRFTSVTDVYLHMFMCDVINFLIIIFGYHAFGQFVSAQTDVVSNLQTNNVPTAFLIMLLIQFLMMFIDRAIYLKKSLLGKLIFQIVLVIGIHVWMFFILPDINQRPFYQNHIAQTWYFFKVLYFLLSAYQIRAGYPKRVTENFLTKSYGTVNLFLFKGYRAIPFLAEITAIMDWMYTGTSLGIGEWMKVWSIHAEVFELKCWRTFEIAYPSPRGTAKKLWIKYLVGGLLLLLLLVIIWFPLLLMNVALTIGGVTNNPIQVDVKISLGAFEPIFQVVADADDITVWDNNLYDGFVKAHSKIEAAASFLQRFSSNQVVSVNIDGESKTVWIISPPQRQLLADRLNPSSNISGIRLLFEWTLTKSELSDPSTAAIPTAYGSHPVTLKREDKARLLLYELLVGESNITNVTIPNLFPQFIYSPGSSSVAAPASSLYTGNRVDYLDVDFTIQSQQNDSTTSWWSVNSLNATEYAGTPKDPPTINMVVLSDKVSPSSLNFLVNYGIIGLYVSVVLVVGRLVRSVFIGTTATIMFNELPYVDRILMLCQDLFLVREEGEYEMEEDLYAKLIFLYRSPKLLIEWTRTPKTKIE